MKTLSKALIVVSLAAPSVSCGDNSLPEPDGEGCGPVLLPTGPLSDPDSFPLPTTCVAGGLAGVAGRWFVADSINRYVYGYPRFEEKCGRLRRVGMADYVSQNGVEHLVISDSSRIMIRDYAHFPPNEPPIYEHVSALVACLDAGGSLAAVYGELTHDQGVGEPVFVPMTGRSFSIKDEPADGGVVLLGEVGARPGSAEPIKAYSVAVSDGYAFLACSDGLDVVDVRDPTRPRHLSHLKAPGASFNDILVTSVSDRRYAFVAAGDTYLIDITDPMTPVLLSDLDVYSHSLQLQTLGNVKRLYVAGLGSSIPVLDVTSPLSPIHLGFIRLPTQQPGVDAIHDLFVDGTLLYVNDGLGGTIAIDLTNGIDEPVELARFSPTVPAFSHAAWGGVAGGRRIVLTGDEGGTGTPDGMAFLRVLDGDPLSPTFMTEIGRYQSRSEVGIHYFQLFGDRAFVAYYQDGLRIVDLSDPSSPVETGHYNTWDDETAYGGLYEGAIKVTVVDDLVYVADSERGLLIFRP